MSQNYELEDQHLANENDNQGVMEGQKGGARVKKSSASKCNGTKKTACGSKEGCVWVPAKGCRVEENLPLATIAKLARAKKTAVPKKEKSVAPSCGGIKKDKCIEKDGCTWVPSKGCRVEENLPLAVLAEIAAKAKKIAEKKAAAALKAKKEAAVKVVDAKEKAKVARAHRAAVLKAKKQKKVGGANDEDPQEGGTPRKLTARPDLSRKGMGAPKTVKSPSTKKTPSKKSPR